MNILKKAIGLAVLTLSTFLLLPPQAKAQGGQATSIRYGVLPVCNSSTLHYVFHKSSGSNQGFYLCTASGWIGFTGPQGGNQLAIFDATGFFVTGNPRLTENGTTLIYTGTGGIQAQAFVTTNTSLAGGFDFAQGPTNTASQCGPTPVNCIGIQAPTTVNTNGWYTLPPAPTAGVMSWSVPASGIVTGSTSGDSNHSTSLTGQTASISSTNLCPASAGACNSSPLGMYEIAWTIRSSVACATPGPAGVTLTIGWTDDVGAKTFVVPQSGTGSSGTSVALGSTSNFGQGQLVLTTTGAAAITYATTYAACTTGTGTYALEIAVFQID